MKTQPTDQDNPASSTTESFNLFLSSEQKDSMSQPRSDSNGWLTYTLFVFNCCILLIWLLTTFVLKDS